MDLAQKALGPTRPSFSAKNCKKLPRQPNKELDEQNNVFRPSRSWVVCTRPYCNGYYVLAKFVDFTLSSFQVIAGIRETDEKFYYIVKEERNYRDALTQCRIRGGTLAMPKDAATNSLISEYISSLGLLRVFIGINDLEKEKQFMYVDNTPLQTFSSWKSGEPNDKSGYEDCVEMLSTGAWNDVDCQLTIYFVCEFMKKG